MSNGRYNEALLQKALIFLAENFKASGSNPKPVVLHSVRVASTLWNQRAPQDSVVAALLHDILEDTNVKSTELQEIFGANIKNIVETLTHNKPDSYTERLEVAIESYKSSASYGYDAVIVRAVDLVDNSFYYQKANSQEEIALLDHKFNAFMDISRDLLINSPYWKLLNSAKKDNLPKIVSLG